MQVKGPIRGNKNYYNIVISMNNEFEGNFKKLSLELNEELASQLFHFASDTGAPPEVIAAAILTSHVEKDSSDISDSRDS